MRMFGIPPESLESLEPFQYFAEVQEFLESRANNRGIHPSNQVVRSQIHIIHVGGYTGLGCQLFPDVDIIQKAE